MGRMSWGTPAAKASAIVPTPPWWTTAAQRRHPERLAEPIEGAAEQYGAHAIERAPVQRRRRPRRPARERQPPGHDRRRGAALDHPRLKDRRRQRPAELFLHHARREQCG